MDIDRPIVFTVIAYNNVEIQLVTKDSRWDNLGCRNLTRVSRSGLFNAMIVLKELGNKNGYAVLFEVD